MGLTWVEAEVAALNRSEWRRRVAQYVHMDVGWDEPKAKDRTHTRTLSARPTVTLTTTNKPEVC